MVVRNNIAKLNEDNCKNIIDYIEQGLTTIQAFKLEFKKTRNNFEKIKSIQYKNDKYFWIFKILEMEMKEIQLIQSC